MSGAGVVTARLEAVPTLSFASAGEPDRKHVRSHLGVGAFGVNASVGGAGRRAGDRALRRGPRRPGDERPRGAVRRGARRRALTVGGQDIDAPAGTLVFFADTGLTREATATADDTVVLAVGAARGVALEPSPWEARALREQGVA